LFEGGLRVSSRPKDRPTADAPTIVAVAQSCRTRMRQSRAQFQSLAPHSEAREVRGSAGVETHGIKTMQGQRRW
jgi:hypothetical protein